MTQLRSMMMANPLGAFNQGRQTGEEQRTKRTLADHMQGAIGGDQGALSAIYGADPEAGFKVQQYSQTQQKGAKEQQAAELKQAAGLYASAPPEMRPQIYSRIRTLAEGVGIVPPGAAPMSLDTPEAEATFGKFIAAIAGDAEEAYTLSPGAKRYQGGKLVAEAPFAPQRPDYQLYEGADGPAWLPKPTGAQPLASAVGGGFGIKETDNYVRSILGKVQVDPNAAPEQQAEAILPFLIQQESGGNPNVVSPKGAQGLTQVMPATGKDPGFGVSPLRDGTPQENVRFGRDYLTAMLRRYPGRPDLALAAYNAGPGVADRFNQPQASNGPGAIPIPGVRPKPKAASIPGGYRDDGRGGLTPIPGGPAQIAIDARADAAAARKAAEDAKALQKQQAGDARQTEAVAAATQLVSAIDTLTKHPGFSDLGTARGDIKINTPLLRNDAKDAHAQLKNIGGQVALSTMAKLKALSSTGATGFGSLTKPELTLLENAIATLQSEDISNAQLKTSLKVVRDTIEKTAKWRPSSAAPGNNDEATGSDIDSLLDIYK